MFSTAGGRVRQYHTHATKRTAPLTLGHLPPHALLLQQRVDLASLLPGQPPGLPASRDAYFPPTLYIFDTKLAH
jgi:hypothetical protein